MSKKHKAKEDGKTPETTAPATTAPAEETKAPASTEEAKAPASTEETKAAEPVEETIMEAKARRLREVARMKTEDLVKKHKELDEHLK